MKMWKCPICGQREMKYGNSDCDGPAECGNTPHITGRFYVDGNGYIRAAGNVRGVGISEIANEAE